LLIVEDDKSVQALYDAGLSNEEFEKRFAGNGEDALNAYYAWKPDIILLDIMLPERSGYTVLKEIRISAHDKSTTIIMATSMSRKNDVLDCMKLGIQGYIVKPFKFKEIAGKVWEYHHRNSACGAPLSLSSPSSNQEGHQDG